MKIVRSGKQWLLKKLVITEIIWLSFCVSVWSVCVSVIELAAIYLLYMMKGTDFVRLYVLIPTYRH